MNVTTVSDRGVWLIILKEKGESKGEWGGWYVSGQCALCNSSYRKEGGPAHIFRILQDFVCMH